VGLVGPPLGEFFFFFFSYPVFEAVGYGYGKIQLDTAGYSDDTARYVYGYRIQLDTVRYSGIQWICCKIAGCWIVSSLKFRLSSETYDYECGS